jgi:hypothetical protein
MVFLPYLHELEAKKTKFHEAKKEIFISMKTIVLLYQDYRHMNYYI